MVLFERWVRQFARDGLKRIADLRRMAMNGSEQNRRLLIRIDDLDSRTLEVLAKQGPEDVRLAVAQHPNLHEDLAQSLLDNERIADAAFKAALKKRLGQWRAKDQAADERTDAASLRAAVEPAPTPSEAPAAIPAAPVAEPEPFVTITATALGPRIELASDDAAAAMDDAPPPQEEIALAPEQSLVAGGTDALDADAPDFDGLDSIQLDLLEAITFAEDEEMEPADASVAAAPDLDETVERILFDILDAQGSGLTEGPALDALREKIASKQPGPLVQSLRRLVRDGFDPDVIVLAYALRAHWHASHVENGNRYTYLDWQSAVTLVGSFDGYPDLDEAIQVLEALGHEWTATGCARSVSEYLQSAIGDLKAYKDHGGTMPPDYFLQ